MAVITTIFGTKNPEILDNADFFWEFLNVLGEMTIIAGGTYDMNCICFF